MLLLSAQMFELLENPFFQRALAAVALVDLPRKVIVTLYNSTSAGRFVNSLSRSKEASKMKQFYEQITTSSYTITFSPYRRFSQQANNMKQKHAAFTK